LSLSLSFFLPPFSDAADCLATIESGPCIPRGEGPRGEVPRGEGIGPRDGMLAAMMLSRTAYRATETPIN
jgi:hypothetical protein